MVKVRHVDERLRLFGNGLDHTWMAVPKHTHRYAGQKIRIRFAFSIPYGRPLTTDKGDRIASVGLDSDLVSLGNNLLVSHVCAPSVAIMSLCGNYVARLFSGDEVARPLPGGKMRVVRYHTQRGKRNAFCSVGRECTYVAVWHPLQPGGWVGW